MREDVGEGALKPERERLLAGRALPGDVAGHRPTQGVNPHRPVALHRVGGLGLLRLLIRVAKIVAPGAGKEMPAWQGMQYAENMFSGDGLLEPLDNGRYSGVSWTTVGDFLRRRSQR